MAALTVIIAVSNFSPAAKKPSNLSPIGRRKTKLLTRFSAAVGGMPLLQDDDGVYRSIITDEPVTIEGIQ